MNERNALSLPAIMASRDARLGGILIAVLAHVACGLRAVLLQHRASTMTANRLALALIALGGVASSLILAGLLNVHIA